jgi:poly(3-hydroxybutyrate) depolymerase
LPGPAEFAATRRSIARRPLEAGAIVEGVRALLLVALGMVAAAAQADEPLPRLNLLPGSVTVSGVSAGGYMATQYQVAFAKEVTGAGIIGAGPWLCAQGVITRALDDCLEGTAGGPDDRALVAALRTSAAARVVDDPSWLAPDRIWIFHGAKDTTIGDAVSDSLLRFYLAFVPRERTRYETRVPAAHGFPTLDAGADCATSEPPWILDCDYDAAGEMLKFLYDGLVEPSTALSGTLREFAQSRYVLRGALASMADTGFLFVPKACAAGRRCRIHVAFHGCRQGIGFVGRTFARQAGYNRWADANDIVVLYPQAGKSLFWPFNPRGCWDWWGYSGADYAARSGAQLSAVRRMLAALGA